MLVLSRGRCRPIPSWSTRSRANTSRTFSLLEIALGRRQDLVDRHVSPRCDFLCGAKHTFKILGSQRTAFGCAGEGWVTLGHDGTVTAYSSRMQAIVLLRQNGGIGSPQKKFSAEREDRKLRDAPGGAGGWGGGRWQGVGGPPTVMPAACRPVIPLCQVKPEHLINYAARASPTGRIDIKAENLAGRFVANGDRQ